MLWIGVEHEEAEVGAPNLQATLEFDRVEIANIVEVDIAEVGEEGEAREGCGGILCFVFLTDHDAEGGEGVWEMLKDGFVDGVGATFESEIFKVTSDGRKKLWRNGREVRGTTRVAARKYQSL